ncbi:hypothetical protein GC098_25505 [Paenibacillus sp. LMG 31458]|uniref:Lipoprotein n=1 Tax=Paenibacillus phytorum TaxID=2654977 RepID=A0ABX1Y1M9_9BACL|nr:hypothetical protein [Paenibacillus phytorum]NOU74703.1 hypothetical protein [Paenibacillus phytorum]
MRRKTIMVILTIVVLLSVIGCKSKGEQSTDTHSGVQLGEQLKLNFALIREIKVEEREPSQTVSKITWRTAGKSLKSKEQIESFEQAVRTADIMSGQPRAIFPNFKLTAISSDGKELFAVSFWTGGMGMIEINDTYCTLTEDGKNKVMMLLKDAEALSS